MESDPQSDQQSFQIIGGAMEVHRELGPSQRGIVYRAALIEELKARGIPTPGNIDLSFSYKGKPLQCIYVPFHLVCFGDILVEVKTVPKLLADDQTDLQAELEDAGCTRGLLLNFARPRLEIRRVTKSTAPPIPSAPAAKAPVQKAPKKTSIYEHKNRH